MYVYEPNKREIIEYCYIPNTSFNKYLLMKTAVL